VTTEEHLAKIKSKCREILELSKARTPGEWKINKGVKGTFVRRADPYKVGEPNDVCRIWNCSRSEGNAAYIAASAEVLEASCRSTIIAIEESQEHQYIGEPESDYFERQPQIIKQIIEAWPEELL
jgi:hypothetical protein